MSQLLPYFGVASLLLAVSVLWARQILLTRKNKIEVIAPRKQEAITGSAASHEDLGQRIFALADWDFVSHNMPLEIQKMFLRERTILTITWLSRTRTYVSLVMRAHLAAAQQIKDLQVSAELKLALNYVLFLVLCDLLIAWIWLRGPVRTRKMIGRTLRTVAWMQHAFEQLMATVDPASYKVFRTSFGHRAVRS